MSEIKVHPFYKMGINYSKKQDFVIDHNRISKKTIEKLVKIGYKLSCLGYSFTIVILKFDDVHSAKKIYWKYKTTI